MSDARRDFLLDTVRIQPSALRLVRPDGRKERLEPLVMDLLVHLAEAAPDVVERRELLSRHWPVHVSDAALHRAIWKLRRALAGDDDERTWIETVPKRGYRLMATVSSIETNAGQATINHTARFEAGPIRVKHPRSSLRLPLVAVFLLVFLTLPAIFLRRATSTLEDRATTSSSGVRSEPVPVTSRIGYESHPAVTPDGRLLVYQHYSKDDDPLQPDLRQWDLWLERLNPSGAQQPERLTHTPEEHEAQPTLSPDGSAVVFARLGPNGSCQLVELDLGTRTEASLRRCGPSGRWPARWPATAFAADGDLIFTDQDLATEPQRVWRLGPSTPTPTALTRPPRDWLGDVDLAPVPGDPEHLVVVRSRSVGRDDLWLVQADGSGVERRLTHHETPIFGVAWDAAGDRPTTAAGINGSVVFGARRGGVSWLWRLHLASGRQERIDHAGRHAASPRLVPPVEMVAGTSDGSSGGLLYEEWQSRINLWQVRPGTSDVDATPLTRDTRWTWMAASSPDGRLAFLTDRRGDVDLMVRDAEGDRRLPLPPMTVWPRLAWSPGGDRIAFAAPFHGSYDLYVVRPSTGDLRRLTHGAADERSPAFSADGESLVYASDAQDGWQIWRLDLYGGENQRLTRSGGLTPAVTPDGGHLVFTRRDRRGLWRQPLGTAGDPELWVGDLQSGLSSSWSLASLPAEVTKTANAVPGVLYFFRTEAGPLELRHREGDGRLRVLLTLDPPGGVLDEVWDLSPPALQADGSIVVAHIDYSASDLWLLPDAY